MGPLGPELVKGYVRVRLLKPLCVGGRELAPGKTVICLSRQAEAWAAAGLAEPAPLSPRWRESEQAVLPRNRREERSGRHA